jgi:hypothetical protein
MVKVYDVAYVPPDQVILNPSVVNTEALINIGCVGAGGVGKDTSMGLEGVAPLEFVAKIITLYVIGPYKLEKVAVLLDTETVCGLTVVPFKLNV